MTRHFLDIDDLSPTALEALLDEATSLKTAIDRGDSHGMLPNATLCMLFEKPSTRTRVSFETGMTQLGGHAIFLGPNDTQLGRGEPLKDTARALSGYADGVMARVFSHDDLTEFAAYADIPVINGLSNSAHPCQTLADLLTIRETFDGFDGVTVAWVGDGNNVARSFAVGCAMVGLDLRVATPAEYGLGDDVRERAAGFDGLLTVTTDPDEAVTDVDVVYTDVWVSMGQEEQRDQKLAAFDEFQVNADLLANTDDARVMHCLPAHRGEEITDDALESERSIVWHQAENRLHAQKALLLELLSP